jgi:hypothetical protein
MTAADECTPGQAPPTCAGSIVTPIDIDGPCSYSSPAVQTENLVAKTGS